MNPDIAPVLTLLWQTFLDLFPLVATLFGFQVFILRRPIPHIRQVLFGLLYTYFGLCLFLIGLEEALFPLGRAMATQLVSYSYMQAADLHTTGPIPWFHYGWIYLFAASVGFATTVAEPALIAVTMKAHEISGGALSALGLRIAVAIGVALGVALGTFRIVTGTPLPFYILAGYALVVFQTAHAPRWIIPIAYDSGGVTTSTVTVPLVTALGLGLAGTLPGRSPILDGFGLIAFASLFPMMTVMGYAQLGAWRSRRRNEPHSQAPPRKGDTP